MGQGKEPGSLCWFRNTSKGVICGLLSEHGSCWRPEAQQKVGVPGTSGTV